MLRTILVGSRVSVQGTFIRKLDNGNILVRVGRKIYEGTPVAQAA